MSKTIPEQKKKIAKAVRQGAQAKKKGYSSAINPYGYMTQRDLWYAWEQGHAS